MERENTINQKSPVEYIERDEALNAVRYDDPDGYDLRVWRSSIAMDMKNRINKIPAADVVPVRRGLWTTHKTKTGKNWWKCSACDFVSEHKAHHNYCPSCGARMDGEE